MLFFMPATASSPDFANYYTYHYIIAVLTGCMRRIVAPFLVYLLTARSMNRIFTAFLN